MEKRDRLLQHQQLLFLLSILFLHNSNLIHTINAVPLHTEDRWIVDDKGGNRVKLACVNWVSHLETVVAEGLTRQPVDAISKHIVSMGFNCVRLTWPIYLATNDTLANKTLVRQSFEGFGLTDAINGMQENNPSFLDLTLIGVFKAVISNLGDNDVMVIIDNHITKPGWCCSRTDGNGFFGDQYFDPDLWIQGLTTMATLFKGTKNVVGMSLRNELRGPKENANDWYKYMQRGAEAVHSTNPDVLVILSGLNFDKDLSFLRTRPLNVGFTKKVVFEVHWYAFSDGDAWKNGNPNQVCGRVLGNIQRMSQFLLDKGFPLFVSEFGIDLRGSNVNDNRYFSCFLAWAAELDLDWALWTLVGSYDFRQGVIGMEEYYGVLDSEWKNVRNSTFMTRISTIQSPLRGPGLSESGPHKIIFHPQTGLCLLRQSSAQPLKLGPCPQSDPFSYTPQKKTLTIKGTYFCLQAKGLDQPAKLALVCSGSGTKWDIISDSKMHLSTKLDKNTTVCLDTAPDNTIITTACKCLSKDANCDPESQWFKIANTTRSPIKSNYQQQLDTIPRN